MSMLEYRRFHGRSPETALRVIRAYQDLIGCMSRGMGPRESELQLHRKSEFTIIWGKLSADTTGSFLTQSRPGQQ